jgi:hypothetical protein
MRILILGGDGYIGFPLACDLVRQGHSVHVLDTYIKRGLGHALFDDGIGLAGKCKILNDAFDGEITHSYCNGTDYQHYLSEYLDFNPDTVVNLTSSVGPDTLGLNANMIEVNICKALREECHYIKLDNLDIDNRKNSVVLQYNAMCTTMKVPEVFGLMAEVDGSDYDRNPVNEVDKSSWQYSYGLQTRLYYDAQYGKQLNRVLLSMLTGRTYCEMQNITPQFTTIPIVVRDISTIIEAGNQPNKHITQHANPRFDLEPAELIAMFSNACSLYGYDVDFQAYLIKNKVLFKHICAVVNQLREELPKMKVL